MKRQKICIVSGILFFTALGTCAQEELKIAPVFSGYTSFEASELVKGYVSIANSGNAGPVISPFWMENAKVGIINDAAIGSHLHIITAIEGKLGFCLTTDYSTFNGDIPSQQPKWDFSIQQGKGLYSFGDPETPILEIEAGYFSYKYDPAVRNLGEYLFRSFCYPASVLNTFDRPYADLLGLRIGDSFRLPVGVLHHDFLLTSETKYYPLKDFSVSELADYTLSRIFSVGAGVSLYRLLPVHLYTSDPSHLKSTYNRYIDSTTMDTAYYSFSGTKLMVRLSFDIKGIIPMDFLGSEDLKIYGEAAILGLKNYPGYYANIGERIPMMVGFNFPTFRIFDVLNLELEFQETKKPNGISNTFYSPWCPIPELEIPDNPREKLKWSLYARKKIGGNLSIIGQVANDHLMPENYSSTERHQLLSDVTLRHGDWWWVLKARFDY